MKFSLKNLAPALLLASLLLLPAPECAGSEPIFVSIGTGGVSGVYFPVGGAICRLVNKDTKKHKVRCTAQSTGASIYNVGAIRSGDLDLGLVQSDIQHYAWNGLGQFAEAGPDKDLRALFSLHAEIFTLMARADAGIAAFDQLPGKRLNLGDPGSGGRYTLELLMAEYGWTADNFAALAEFSPADMAGALCDNAIDAYVYVVAHPNGSVREAVASCPSRIVPVSGPVVDAFLKKYPFYPKAAIPGGMYRGMDENVQSFGPRATLLASARLDENIAYLITKAVFEELEEFKKLHPALGSLTPQNMLEGNSAPYHPGAERYFKEKGLVP